jgi:hypothetical protein
LPFNNQTLVEQTLKARFFTFIVDRNDPEFYQIAIQCANECEGWARAIREYANLPTAVTSVTPVATVVSMPTQVRSQSAESSSNVRENDDDSAWTKTSPSSLFGLKD